MCVGLKLSYVAMVRIAERGKPRREREDEEVQVFLNQLFKHVFFPFLSHQSRDNTHKSKIKQKPKTKNLLCVFHHFWCVYLLGKRERDREIRWETFVSFMAKTYTHTHTKKKTKGPRKEEPFTFF